MKYLVFSDLHGSFDALQFVLNAYKKYDCDAFLCLGDILYHGPRNDLPKSYNPKKVIEELNPYGPKILAVKGNCDGEVDQMVLNFPVLATYNSFYFNHRRFFLSHGHTYSPNNLPELENGSVFLSGHTHIPTAKKENGIYLLNPGSCALPKQNHPQTIAVLDENRFEIFKEDGSSYMHIDFE